MEAAGLPARNRTWSKWLRTTAAWNPPGLGEDREGRSKGIRGSVFLVMSQDAGAHIVSDVRAGTHAERNIRRARSPQYGCQSSGTSPSSRRIGGTTGRVSGFSGFLSSFIPASSGVRLPLRSLQA